MKKKLLLLTFFLFCVIGFSKPAFAVSSQPQFGNYVKTVQVGEQVKAIDSRDGWWLIAEQGKLCWLNAGPTSYWDTSADNSRFPILLRVTQKNDIYEAAAIHYYNKGDKITVAQGTVTGWWKVTTPEGYTGWVNAGPTGYDSSGNLISTSDTPLPAYYTALQTPLGYVKTVQVGEQVKAIDSIPGWWLIAEQGKLCWLNAGPTSYWDTSADNSKFPILLKVTQQMDIYEAGVAHYYKKGDKITVAQGTVTGWWKVTTPEGYTGWVNAGPTGYDASGNLISTSDTPLPAYFGRSGSSTSIGVTIPNNSDYWSLAKWAASQLGWNAEFIYAQWELETGFFSSANLRYNNNIAGQTWYPGLPESIKGTARPANEGGYYIKYDNAAVGYVDFINHNSRYNNVKNYSIAEDEASVIAADGWAVDSNYASKIINIIQSNRRTGL